MKNPNKEQFNVRVEPWLADAIRAEAKASGMKVADLTRHIMTTGFRHYKQRTITERDRLAVMGRLRGKRIWPEVNVDNG